MIYLRGQECWIKMKTNQDINEFLEHGYTKDEIQRMSDEEFVYTAVMLVDGITKEEIDKGLGK